AQVLAINVKDWDKFPVEKKRKIISAIYSPEQIEELEKWPWFDPVFALSAPVGFGIKDIARQAIRAGAKAALKETGKTVAASGTSLAAETGMTLVGEPLEERHPILAGILAPLVGVGVGVAAERGTKALLKAAKKPAKPKLEEVEKVEEILKPEIKEPKVVEKPKILEEKPKKVLKAEKGLAPDLEEITKEVKEAEEIIETKPEIKPKIEKEIQARKQELEIEELTKEDFDKALEEIKKITPSLEKQKLPEDLKIIEVQLTGSRARGEARPISDVDYFVYVNKDLNPWQESFLMHTLVDKLSKKEVKLYTPDRAGIVDVKIVQPRHERWQVMQALKEGKPVSEDILKDYPDLVEKYKSKPQKEPWQMTKEEFLTYYPEKTIEDHKKAIREAFIKQKLVSKKAVKDYPDLLKVYEKRKQEIIESLKKNPALMEEYIEKLPKILGEPIPELEKIKKELKKTPVEVKPEVKIKKEPWQMTRKEWEKVFGFPKISEKRAKEIDRMFYHGELWKVPLKDYLGFRFKDAGKKITFADLGEVGKVSVPTPKEIESAKEFHKGIVEQALKEGKPVPEKVLKDYPDLVEKYKPAEIKPESEAEITAPIYEGEGWAIFPAEKKKFKIAFEDSELGQLVKDALHNQLEEVKAGEPPRLYRVESAQGPIEYYRSKSSFPSWFKNKGWSKERVVSVLEKTIKGEPLTEKQAEIVKEALNSKEVKDYIKTILSWGGAEVKLYAGLPLNEVLKKGFKTLNQLIKITKEKAAEKELYKLADILGYGKEFKEKDIKGIKAWTAKLYNIEDLVRRYGDVYPEIKEIEYAMKWIREPQANRWAHAVDESVIKPLNKLSKESKERVFKALYKESLTGKPDLSI
ncbi:MAG: hypothetical protein DRP29_10100, partial [Thermodesulfobacteriota bacterium]